ncbi:MULTISPECIES: hypothetical protein [Pseudomonas]|uniref:hypothetical protein n=1 Tax=Pseudomonas TaxID=286 RepID=UPI0004D45281|nr:MULTISPECIES: hypothetical protein [Pseudomonas]KES20939.1 hypothetical protein FG99_27775 [Pseudomonas sp. AAC]KRV63991.1 hypothetical protein AO742_26845 [Pseudomonas citronellolis]KRW75549.1 hypothetical protein AO738_25375 [Pseudomonas citronellolis]MBH3436085.1 hypothetical protein [Pseudomonas citronellolis]OHR86797.1 hypothetical protein HMPREF3289_24590 [Pseudomonas sp. HMSC75E02]
MVTHFLIGTSQAACGRSDPNVAGSQDVAQVSCKTCRRTNAFTQAQEAAGSAPAVPKPAPAAAPKSKQPARAPAQSGRDAARQAWQARLSALSGKTRLPRGNRRAQAYV